VNRVIEVSTYRGPFVFFGWALFFRLWFTLLASLGVLDLRETYQGIATGMTYDIRRQSSVHGALNSIILPDETFKRKNR